MSERARAEQNPPSQAAALDRRPAPRQPVSEMPRFFVYGKEVGGAGKRAVDIVIAALTAPVWMLALAMAALVIKARRPSRRAVSAHRRVGYGGKLFESWSLNVSAPSAQILSLPGLATNAPPAPRSAWVSLIERLPEMWNVLRGEMSLVGPRPLTNQAFDALGWPRKHYASARPGIIAPHVTGRGDGGRVSSYKRYVMEWSFALDMRTLRQAAQRLMRPGAGAAPAKAGATQGT